MKKITFIMIAILLCISVLTGCSEPAINEEDRVDIQLEGERGMIVVSGSFVHEENKGTTFLPDKLQIGNTAITEESVELAVLIEDPYGMYNLLRCYYFDDLTSSSYSLSVYYDPAEQWVFVHRASDYFFASADPSITAEDVLELCGIDPSDFDEVVS